jgi:hypothetical protein
MATYTPEEASKYAADPYEFTPAQNEVIGSLGNSMKWVAVPAFALAALNLMYLIMTAVWVFKTGAYKDWQMLGLLLYFLLSLVLTLAVARWCLTASLSFRAIVETSGRDVSFLMLALDNLRKMFGLVAAFVKVFLILSLIGLVLSVIQVYRSDSWKQLGGPEPPAQAPATR